MKYFSQIVIATAIDIVACLAFNAIMKVPITETLVYKEIAAAVILSAVVVLWWRFPMDNVKKKA